MLFNSQEGCGLVVVSGVWACDDVKDEQGWAAIGVFLSRVRARELLKMSGRLWVCTRTVCYSCHHRRVSMPLIVFTYIFIHKNMVWWK